MSKHSYVFIDSNMHTHNLFLIHFDKDFFKLRLNYLYRALGRRNYLLPALTYLSFIRRAWWIRTLVWQRGNTYRHISYKIKKNITRVKWRNIWISRWSSFKCSMAESRIFRYGYICLPVYPYTYSFTSMDKYFYE